VKVFTGVVGIHEENGPWELAGGQIPDPDGPSPRSWRQGMPVPSISTHKTGKELNAALDLSLFDTHDFGSDLLGVRSTDFVHT